MQTTIRKEQIKDIPLRIEDWDGNPSVYPTDRMVFSGAIVTDLGNGDVLVTISGGGTIGVVKDADNSPTVTNVDTLVFSGAVVTDLGGGDVLITINGSTIIGGAGDNLLAHSMAVGL